MTAAKRRPQRRGGEVDAEQAAEARVADRSASMAAHVGRPVVHTERWTKIAVRMLDHQVAYLDLVSICVRLARHRALSRAELIGAFVEFMQQSGIDFSEFATEGEIVGYVTDYFRCIPNRGRMPLLESSLFQGVAPAQRPRREGR